MKYEPLSQCRLCGSPRLVEVLNLGTQCLTGVFPKVPNNGLSSGPVTLTLCDQCCLLQLGETYDLTEMYGLHYGYRSGLNQSMVRHLRAKVALLAQRVTVESADVVLDIGSNDGTLLRAYQEQGARRVGFDPSGAKFRSYYPDGAELIPDFFTGARYKDEVGRPAKVITSIAMFYDLPQPQIFVNDIAATLHDEGVWHTEQSYMPAMLRTNSYDTVCQEHLEYYGVRQLKWMADRANLKIVDLTFNDVNGGSFAATLAKVEGPYSEASALIDEVFERETSEGLADPKPYLAFANRAQRHRDELTSLIREIRHSGKTIVGSGASTKGNVLLQYCRFTRDDIACVAEVNPDKYGCYTPGTWIPIVPEAEADSINPDYKIVLPWHFRDGFIAREQAFLARGGKLIFPLPRIEIVSSEGVQSRGATREERPGS
ncbi:MAG: class I SAM-dependent methyltransferase [Gemmatimonadaceae bacterium]